MPAKLVTIFWRDIPAQINAQSGRVREQRILPRPFQRAIERATRKADITTSDAYVRQWRREARPCGDDLLAEALAGAAELEQRYPQERLFALVANLGWEPGLGDVPIGLSADDETDDAIDDGIDDEDSEMEEAEFDTNTDTATGD